MQEIQHIMEVVKQQTVPAIYLWYGEDRFLIWQALLELKKFYLVGDSSGSGIEIVSAKNKNPTDIVTMANTVSFFQKRLVVVEDAPYFQDGHSEELDPFYTYFANPNTDTCLLFLTEKVHKGRKLYKAIEKVGIIYEFSMPKRPYEWETWVLSELKSRGKSMASKTLPFFLDWAGHKPGVLIQELDKLAVYVGEETTIKEEDIKVVTTRTVEANVFDMLNAVAQRKIDQALQKLYEVLREEHPLKVLTLLVRQVRLLLGANVWRRRGENVAGLTSALGIKSSYEAQKIWVQSQRIPEDLLAKALQECLKTEIALKTGGGDPIILIELMIIKFCQ
ncbi:MAG: DNA polymerase III subunit delta [Desulfitobacteriaceae bacterium]